MPKQDRYKRIKHLDKLLQNRSGYSYEQLANKLNVKKTSIKNYMRGYDGDGIVNGQCWSDFMLEKYDHLIGNWESIFEGFKSSREGDNQPRATRWRYKINGFSIFDDELTMDRIDSILPFLELTSQIDGLNDMFEETTDLLLDLIESKKHWHILEDIKRIRNSKPTIKMGIQLILNELNNDIFKNDYLKIIRKSIVEKKALQIKYKKFQDPHLNNIIIHPYLITESSKRWYVICLVSNVLDENNIAFKDRIGKINSLGLERIHEIKEAKSTIYKTTKINIIKTLNSAIGVSIENYENPKKENLVLKIDEDLVKYFKTKPLFPEISEKIEGNIFTYKDIHVTTELVNLIFSYSNKIEVISPNSIREKIKKKIEKMRKKYILN